MPAAQANSHGKAPIVCVFCASSPGKDPIHLESARKLGKSLHDSGYSLVYGGGTMGIMGELAKTLVSLSGPRAVRGIIPRALIRTEVDPSTRADQDHSGHRRKVERTMSSDELQQITSNEDSNSDIIPQSEFGATTVVPDMHTRKRMMAQSVEAGGPGSGFVALAGGYGTIEEVMEMVTWNQLGIHSLPIVLVNINGYWNGLLDWVKNSVREGFVGEGSADILVEVQSTDEVIQALRDYKEAPGRFKLDWNNE